MCVSFVYTGLDGHTTFYNGGSLSNKHILSDVLYRLYVKLPLKYDICLLQEDANVVSFYITVMNAFYNDREVIYYDIVCNKEVWENFYNIAAVLPSVVIPHLRSYAYLVDKSKKVPEHLHLATYSDRSVVFIAEDESLVFSVRLL